MKPEQKEFAQALRRDATPEERHLWYDFLKNYPCQFRRQVPFGPYFLDFYCSEAKLAVELDGSQHYEPQGLAYDAERSQKESSGPDDRTHPHRTCHSPERICKITTY